MCKKNRTGAMRNLYLEFREKSLFRRLKHAFKTQFSGFSSVVKKIIGIPIKVVEEKK